MDDMELQLACLRAYNDFLSEFASTDPTRLVGIGLVPTDDIQAGVDEVKRIANYVTTASGGRGAVREICELLLKAHGRWEDLLRKYEISPIS